VSHLHVLRSLNRFRRCRGSRVPFSCFAPRTRFQRYRGRRLPFSSFARRDLSSAAPRASGPVFKFCVPGLIFSGNEGVGSHFDVLRARTYFRRYRRRRHLFSCFSRTNPFRLYLGRWCPFPCFARPDSFSAVPWASVHVFMFCAPRPGFDGTEGVMSRFLVLRARNSFRRYRGRHVQFSCFARLDSFSAVPRASALVFMFCAPGLGFDSTEGVMSRFHVLRARTRFQPYRGSRLPFSCFASPDSFSAVTWASGPVFMFCAPVLIFGGTEGVGTCFLALCA
jgi:hypothetical protein